MKINPEATTIPSPAPLTGENEIEDLALLLWEQAGCPAGRQSEFWQKAEDEIVNRGKAPDKNAADG
jgi:Protein of unknown function (DUF2934)